LCFRDVAEQLGEIIKLCLDNAKDPLLNTVGVLKSNWRNVRNILHDEGRIATTPDILPPLYVLKLGQFYFEVPPKDVVKPNFRTPPMVFHVRQGAVAKDI
jgi:hypothetical protein